MGNRQVPARLALLPDAEPRWGRLGLSAVVQVSILIFLLLVPLMYPEQMKTGLKFVSVEIAQPLTEIPVAPEPPPPPKPKAVVPKAEVKPTPVEPVKLNPAQPHIFANLAKPKPVEPKVEKIDVKAPDVKPTFEAAKIDVKENGPKRPKDDVKVGNLGSGSAAVATVVAPVNKVQTGGFGDPNGLPGKGDPNHAGEREPSGFSGAPGWRRLREWHRRKRRNSRHGGEHGIWKRDGHSTGECWRKEGHGSCRRIQRCRCGNRGGAEEESCGRRSGGYYS